MTDFDIRYRWWRRPDAVPLLEGSMEGIEPPRWAALKRFISQFTGEFTVPLTPEPLTLELEDLPIVFDYLPKWLNGVASGEGRRELLFASQGTELKLVADREADSVRLSVKSIAPDRELPARFGPVTVPVDRFLRAWREFVLALLDALVAETPSLRDDQEFSAYRKAIQDDKNY